MNIQPINYTNVKSQRVNFKSTYPVVHWVAETNGSYAPALSLDIVKKLQGSIVRALNALAKNTEKPIAPEFFKLKEYLKINDKDFRKNQHVRSFYDHKQAAENSVNPISYVISGDDIAWFNDELAKDIGRSKGLAKQAFGNSYSVEAKQAMGVYNRNGLKFVNSMNNRLIDKNGQTYVLHTKFEIQRNKTGKIKGYKFIAAKFLPEFGENSPLERYRRHSGV